MLLKDKVVIVSGIGPGLGQELAFASAREGARVVLAARTQSFLDEIEAKLRDGGTETLSLSTDIADRVSARLSEKVIATCDAIQPAASSGSGVRSDSSASNPTAKWCVVLPVGELRTRR